MEEAAEYWKSVCSMCMGLEACLADWSFDFVDSGGAQNAKLTKLVEPRCRKETALHDMPRSSQSSVIEKFTCFVSVMTDES
ncbi:hypothetical protein [Bradyrhizobium sp. WSM471]|uniref:hypothetical protein n=1 Tax=Bradyrhizobium sp. WSM471 TaxID=319017 RepID=UPI00024D22DF|nr:MULTISPECIES: hypothetical protein [Bradyrhizobium]EHR01408.1 hypothetical protein Bra471DRAFT_02135 [Bradyrhizobium sp. WSM471]UFW43467.1 hypothetical protein BcanWSM471_10485 [Bradyrhizobium canariense]